MEKYGNNCSMSKFKHNVKYVANNDRGNRTMVQKITTPTTSCRTGYRNPVSHALTSAPHKRLVPLHTTHFLIEQQAIKNASTAAQYNLSSRTITLFDYNCKRRQAATPYRNPTISSCDSLRLVLWSPPQRRRKAKSLIVLHQRKMQTSRGYTARSDTHTAR